MIIIEISMTENNCEKLISCRIGGAEPSMTEPNNGFIRRNDASLTRDTQCHSEYRLLNTSCVISITLKNLIGTFNFRPFVVFFPLVGDTKKINCNHRNSFQGDKLMRDRQQRARQRKIYTFPLEKSEVGVFIRWKIKTEQQREHKTIQI